MKLEQDPVSFLRTAVAGDYITFFRWILDQYTGVRKKSSLHQYWRQVKMLYKRHAGKLLDKDLVDNVNNVGLCLQIAHGFANACTVVH
jgi:hypothetical protein